MPTHVMNLGKEVAAGMQIMYSTSVGVPCWWRAWCVNRSPRQEPRALPVLPGSSHAPKRQLGRSISDAAGPWGELNCVATRLGPDCVRTDSLKKSYFWQLQAK